MATLCPNGHQSEVDDYCDSCGTRMSVVVADDDDDDLVWVEEVAAPGIDAEPCPRCGVLRVDDDPFCENCGHRFGSVDAPALVWEIEISADREQYDRLPAPDVEFPSVAVCRVVELTEAQMLIGRRSESHGSDPQIDCSGPPDDPAISHRHALLVRDSEGRYSICDLGSTNGTTLNRGVTSLVPNVSVPLEDGDRIHIGAWTALTIRSLS